MNCNDQLKKEGGVIFSSSFIFWPMPNLSFSTHKQCTLSQLYTPALLSFFPPKNLIPLWDSNPILLF
jgi:hypothetical protein